MIYGRPREKPYTPEIKSILKLNKNDYEDNQFIFMSACRDDEYSWDAWFREVYAHHGVMTYFFVDTVMEAWNNDKTITYQEAFKKMCDKIKSRRFQQNPTLEFYKEMDTKIVFGYDPSKKE